MPLFSKETNALNKIKIIDAIPILHLYKYYSQSAVTTKEYIAYTTGADLPTSQIICLYAIF